MNDAGGMCLVVALAIGGLLAFGIGHAIGTSLRRPAKGPTSTGVRSFPPSAPPPPGPLWQNARLWEDIHRAEVARLSRSPALRQPRQAVPPPMVDDPHELTGDGQDFVWQFEHGRQHRR